MLIHKIQKCEKMFMLKKSNWTQRRQKSWKTFEQLACKICTNWRIRSKSQLTKRLKCSVMRWKSYHWSFQSQRKSEIDQWIFLLIFHILLVGNVLSPVIEECQYQNQNTLIWYQTETSQELRMLSSVRIKCQITKIVINPGSQLSVL